MSANSVVARMGAASGVGAGALTFESITLTDPQSPADLGPEAPASALADALIANRVEARVGAYLMLAAVFLLIWFVGFLTAHVRAAEQREGWLSLVVLGSGSVTAGVLLIEAGFDLAASELSSYGPDTQVAKMLFVWGWLSASLLAPPIGALVLSTTIASFRSRALPAWFRVFSLSAIALQLTATITGAPGFAAVLGVFWIVVLSGTLSIIRNPGVNPQPASS
jgi:hypothetical protein